MLICYKKYLFLNFSITILVFITNNVYGRTALAGSASFNNQKSHVTMFEAELFRNAWTDFYEISFAHVVFDAVKWLRCYYPKIYIYLVKFKKRTIFKLNSFSNQHYSLRTTLRLILSKSNNCYNLKLIELQSLTFHKIKSTFKLIFYK